MIKKHGGIWFVRFGCLSITVCRAKPQTEWQWAFHYERWTVRIAILTLILLWSL